MSDPDKKAKYDSPQSHANNGGFGGGFQGPGADFVNAEFEKFKRAAGFGGYGPRGIRKGTSIQVIVELTLEEVFSGVKKKVKYKKDKKCDHCHGNGSKNGTHLHNCTTCGGSGQVFIQHGHIRINDMCHQCGGYGKIITEECEYCSGAGVGKTDVEINVELPPGVLNGSQTVIANLGNDVFISENGIPGDLYLLINVLDHDKFEREGDNLIYRLRASFTQAALGGKVEVPTIDGKTIAFELAECTPNGRVFRLKEKGLPSNIYRGKIGDLLVLIDVKMPNSLTEEEKEILKQLTKETNFKLA